jgi:hypothetical protein
VRPALGLVALALVAAGCASRQDDETASASSSSLEEAATITFDAQFHASVSGALQKGGAAHVVYDARRLTACRGEQGGLPQWSITGYYRIAGGPVRAFDVASVNQVGEPSLDLDRSGDLEIWFQNTNRWGCDAYDSAFGSNYHFAVAPSPREPGWMGNVRSAIQRETCGGGPCESTLRPVTSDILYDTYARQRAAVRVVEFDVWKEGVTDHDDPDLWKKLDVQVHYRVIGTERFTAKYVDFDHRVGNDARYSIDLRGLDSVVGATTITDPANCPSYPVTYVAGANQAYVEAPVEFYMTVNGAELRPDASPAFVVRYQNYAQLYAPCVTP